MCLSACPSLGLSHLGLSAPSHPGWLFPLKHCAVLSRSVMYDSSQPRGLQPTRLLSPWGFYRQEYWTLLQGVFLTQGSNPSLLHRGQILYHPSHQACPRILEWVAFLFSKGSSQPRNWTGVSWIAGGLFTSWATREDLVTEVNFQLFSLQIFSQILSLSPLLLGLL